jgi:DNA polymerase V
MMSLVKLHTSTTLDLYSALTDTELKLPVASSRISAGFSSPANDFTDVAIDLNKHLIQHPSSTFFGRVKGQSMKDEGINEGDLLIIDKALEPVDGKIAVYFIDRHCRKCRFCSDKDIS